MDFNNFRKTYRRGKFPAYFLLLSRANSNASSDTINKHAIMKNNERLSSTE